MFVRTAPINLVTQKAHGAVFITASAPTARALPLGKPWLFRRLSVYFRFFYLEGTQRRLVPAFCSPGALLVAFAIFVSALTLFNLPASGL